MYWTGKLSFSLSTIIKRTLHSIGLCFWLSLESKQFLFNSTCCKTVEPQILFVDINFTNRANPLVKALIFKMSYHFNYIFSWMLLHNSFVSGVQKEPYKVSLAPCLGKKKEKKKDVLKGPSHYFTLQNCQGH